MTRKRKILFLIITSILWFLFTAIYYVNYYFSGVLLIASGFVLWAYLNQRKRRGLQVESLFCLFYMISIGLASLKLVGIYDVTWSLLTWICMWLFFLTVMAGMFFFLPSKLIVIKKIKRIYIKTYITKDVSDIYIVLFTILSGISFTYFVITKGYIPLFSSNQNAYLEFGTGSVLSLFYQISVILPGMSLYNMLKKRKHYILYGIAICVNVAICALVKSRDFLLGVFCILFVVLYVIIFNNVKFFRSKIRKKGLGKTFILFLTVVVSVSLFALLTQKRNYSYDYFVYLFDVNEWKLPLSLIQPYVYITSGYYNFDRLINNIDTYAYGLVTINPLSILLRIESFKQIVAELPKHHIIGELNLYTYLGGPVQDFGVIGIPVIGVITGYIFSLAENMYYEMKNVFTLLLFAMALHHVILIFFSYWLSNFQYLVYVLLMIVGILILEKKEVQ